LAYDEFVKQYRDEKWALIDTHRVPKTLSKLQKVGELVVVGIVNTADLKIRTDAGAKYPVVGALSKDAKITITGEAKNGDTLWYRVSDGWVAARFVTLS